MGGGMTSSGDFCATCGLCCDGTLFEYAHLQPDEIDAAMASGLEVGEFAGEPGFAQPCRHLCGTRCNIYVDRPKACRKYRCAMLKRMETGEIAAEQAAKHVAAVRSVVTSLNAEMLPGVTIRQCREQLEKAVLANEEVAATTRMKLYFGVLELLLDKHFRSPRQRFFTGMPS